MTEVRKPIILWCGRFTQIGGYRSVTINHARGLIEQGARIALFDLTYLKFVGPDISDSLQVLYAEDKVEIKTHNPDDLVVVVVHERPDQFNRITVDGRARVVGHTVFEMENLPQGWNALAASVDEIWVASEYNRASFSRCRIPAFMINKVPHSINTAAYSNNIGSIRPVSDDRIMFFTVCSSMLRRDLGSNIRAFQRAFSGDDTACYVIKLSGLAAAPASVEFVRSMLRESETSHQDQQAADKVILITRDMSDEEMIRLYQGCDVYVSAERANGWDMPSMEAMACGKPVIGPYVGGATEYRDKNVSLTYPVTDAKIPIPTTEYNPLYTAQYWSIVDENMIAETMVKARDANIRKRIGEAAKQRIVTQYDSNVVAKRIKDAVSVYELADYRSNHPATISISTKPIWRTSEFDVSMIGNLFAWMLARSPKGLLATRKFIKSLPESDLRELVGFADSDPMIRAMREAHGTSWRLAHRKLLAICRCLILARRRKRFLQIGGQTGIMEGIYNIFVVPYNPTRKITEDNIEARKQACSRYPLIPVFNSEKLTLRNLANKYRGERCFVMGNGPSLNSVDLSKLANEYTFGVNKIHLLFDRIDWRPSFYTLLDWRVGPSMIPHIEKMNSSLKFLPVRFRGIFPNSDTTYWFTTRPVLDNIRDQFRDEIDNGIPSKGTILMTAIQIAFFLGFKDIYLVGVDANYSIPSTVRQSGPDRFRTGTKIFLQSTEDNDPNHFDPLYFGKGDKWHDPNVDEMIRQYKNMRKGVEFHGGRILNATKGGKLEVFERVDFDSLFVS